MLQCCCLVVPVHATHICIFLASQVQGDVSGVFLYRVFQFVNWRGTGCPDAFLSLPVPVEPGVRSYWRNCGRGWSYQCFPTVWAAPGIPALQTTSGLWGGVHVGEERL